MYNKIINRANNLWNYLNQFNQISNCDIVIVCCSYDLRVCDYACEYFKKAGAKKIVFSENLGNWTRDLWSKTEADIFNDRAIKNGIDEKSIIRENRATNLGENISYSKKYLKKEDRVTYISKGNTLLRIKLTVPKYINNEFFVSGPKFNFPQEVSNVVGVYGTINEMVGDIQRIITYPDLGYQEKHTLPMEILDSYHYLVDKGYNDHLIK